MTNSDGEADGLALASFWSLGIAQRAVVSKAELVI